MALMRGAPHEGGGGGKGRSSSAARRRPTPAGVRLLCWGGRPSHKVDVPLGGGLVPDVGVIQSLNTNLRHGHGAT